MKKRMISLLLTGLMCLCLMPTTAQAASLYEQFPYEVKPFRAEDFSPNPDNAIYLGSTEPTIEIKEMTINGKTVEVCVFPAGTEFKGLGGIGMGSTTAYINGEIADSYYYNLSNGLPAQGVYQIEVYSNYYGYLNDAWVTAEGSGSVQPDPEQPDPEQPEPAFSDVSPDAWYAGYIQTVYEKKLFAGTGDGTFAPEANMTYAEFLTVLSQFSGETITPVEGGAWYEGYVNWAQPLIPAGMAEKFDPIAPITRQDMAALFGTFLAAYDHSDQVVNPGQANYTDAASIADYAVSGVELCYELGIMSGGSNGAFAPQANATRAEVAVTMVQMARVMGK